MLLSKHIPYGVNGEIFLWIKTSLRYLSQVIRISLVQSYPQLVLSGISYDGVLVPLLFAIYINDLLEVAKSGTYLFTGEKMHFNCNWI